MLKLLYAKFINWKNRKELYAKKKCPHCWTGYLDSRKFFKDKKINYCQNINCGAWNIQQKE